MPEYVYQNKHYNVIIGKPPQHAKDAEVRDLYIVVNRETGVEEYYHTVLYMAREFADHYSKALDGDVEAAQTEMQGLGIANIN